MQEAYAIVKYRRASDTELDSEETLEYMSTVETTLEEATKRLLYYNTMYKLGIARNVTVITLQVVSI